MSKIINTFRSKSVKKLINSAAKQHLSKDNLRDQDQIFLYSLLNQFWVLGFLLSFNNGERKVQSVTWEEMVDDYACVVHAFRALSCSSNAFGSWDRLASNQ